MQETKFKVGDKVRVKWTDEEDESLSIDVGSEGLVTGFGSHALHGGLVRVDLEHGRFMFLPGQLDLVK